ncbi:hypothetical protein AB205_0062410 [Aquarana catesbeiana]|uniref:G-protein coupled receptors family 1 profile domain-containing protein n=1 Tax=Aquarana catesbeiana TaxID=8400 RepID=A0A2G9RKS9_AQUCT|nr:hypothetical protein AB205_0062410 [Aquarana catesbeiana]
MHRFAPMRYSYDKISANTSHIEEFILLGFSNFNSKLQLMLFTLFLLIYVFTILGNLIIITVATLDSLLHTPMYYFLRNLSFLEICYISVTLPKLLQTFVAKKKSIPFYVLYSYGRIIAAILRISTNTGRKKVFSTCASHFVSVTLFFGTGAFTYVRVKTSDTPDNDKILSLLYSVVTPLLNPLIYSLRNQDVKGGFRKILYKSVGIKDAKPSAQAHNFENSQ